MYLLCSSFHLSPIYEYGNSLTPVPIFPFSHKFSSVRTLKMNPTNYSITNHSSLQLKQHQHFFPQMEENPPDHLYGPPNPNHSSSSVNLPTSVAGPFLYYSPGGISLCSGGDPSPVCLKHGKRHCGNRIPGSGEEVAVVRRRNSARTPAVARCQVEGCHVRLEKAKDYQQRHKVCEVHSKASRAIVLGLDQRFCQRCCRFHVVSEFDGSKRSCRRKLADHNQRRRKSTHDSLVSEKFTTKGALSLLSTTVDNSNINTSSPSDISSRSSADLRDLIAEIRAANFCSNLQHNYAINREKQEGAVTLDLMGAPTATALGLLSESRHMNKEGEEEECSVLWNSWNGLSRD